jgi:hypothetical protein
LTVRIGGVSYPLSGRREGEPTSRAGLAHPKKEEMEPK